MSESEGRIWPDHQKVVDGDNCDGDLVPIGHNTHHCSKEISSQRPHGKVKHHKQSYNIPENTNSGLEKMMVNFNGFTNPIFHQTKWVI